VKTWSSIAEKIERDRSDPKNLSEITDVAGIRIIALFRRDVERISKIIESYLDVLDREDTFDRLAENQFGYGSIHYQARPPAEWLKVPTLRKLEGLQAEIQVRTGSQHIWAAASHVLQYKKEAHVPIPLRRSINRAAALLETIDLEFERLLLEREVYTQEIRVQDENLPLDTESLRRALDEVLPAQNRAQNDDYAALLDDLLTLNITTTDKLKQIVAKHLREVMKSEGQEMDRCAKEVQKNEEPTGTSIARFQAGVYFTHVGLAREALREEFGHEIKLGTARKKKRRP
jgi:putative GTP pyrophosphokinase